MLRTLIKAEKNSLEARLTEAHHKLKPYYRLGMCRRGRSRRTVYIWTKGADRSTRPCYRSYATLTARAQCAGQTTGQTAEQTEQKEMLASNDADIKKHSNSKALPACWRIRTHPTSIDD